MSGRELARKALVVALVFGTIGIALKFLTIFYQSGVQGYSVYFPFFPNVLDSIFLIVAVLWLALRKR